MTKIEEKIGPYKPEYPIHTIHLLNHKQKINLSIGLG